MLHAARDALAWSTTGCGVGREGAPNLSEVLARRFERHGPRIDGWVYELRNEKMRRCNASSVERQPVQEHLAMDGGVGDELSIAAGLPYDLVLGRDWLFFCRETLLLVSFNLPSGIVGPRQQSNAVFLSQTFCGMVDMVDVPAQLRPSLKLLNDILLGHHATRTRISYNVDAFFLITSPVELVWITAWIALCLQDRITLPAVPSPRTSSLDMSKAVLNILLSTDDKQISTESLSHVAAALNISVSGDRNLRFKLRAEIRKHAETVACAGPEIRSSASIADFFNSFESHCILRTPTQTHPTRSYTLPSKFS
ncbi:hypothetical protein B0H14DRAFT_3157472 [Mycena olivaceomarginata]|nr:hypothetical protein B0H14DRAFT_3157472 [Mycena olivaceomarginata]